MGLFDNIFGGGRRDEKSVQSDINKALKDSGGKWTENLNDLVAERDRTRSRATTSSSGRNALSQGLGSFGRAVSSIPRNIARDVKMGTSAGLFSGRDKQAENLKSKGFSQADIKDYFARTDATIARNAAQQDSRRNERSNDAPVRAPIDAPVDEQGPVYRNPFGSIPPQTINPYSPARGVPAEITPAMRNEALRIFESQRGAGQVPYQMQPYQQGLGSIRRPRFQDSKIPRHCAACGDAAHAHAPTTHAAASDSPLSADASTPYANAAASHAAKPQRQPCVPVCCAELPAPWRFSAFDGSSHGDDECGGTPAHQ
jgi:hypothetical protein